MSNKPISGPPFFEKKKTPQRESFRGAMRVAVTPGVLFSQRHPTLGSFLLSFYYHFIRRAASLLPNAWNVRTHYVQRQWWCRCCCRLNELVTAGEKMREQRKFLVSRNIFHVQSVIVRIRVPFHNFSGGGFYFRGCNFRVLTFK